MSQTVGEHRAASPDCVRCAVVTVSDTRSPQTDRGGDLLVELLTAAGNSVVTRELVPDEPVAVRGCVSSAAERDDVDAILLTGGTGISRRDRTFETVSGLLTRTLPGYGELFRQLSFAEIGAAAMLSRAVGGLIDTTVVLTMPGSPAAVRLALARLVLPELGHLVREAQR